MNKKTLVLMSLACSSILSIHTNTIEVHATEGVVTPVQVSQQSVVNNANRASKIGNTKNVTVVNPESPKQVTTRNRAYTKLTHKMVYPDLEDSLTLNRFSISKISKGVFVEIKESKRVNNVDYVFISYLGKDIGWVLKDTLEITTYATVKQVTPQDINIAYGVVKDSEFTYTLPVGVEDSKRTTSLKKGEEVEILEEVIITIPDQYETWHYHESKNTIEPSGWVSQNQLENIDLKDDSLYHATILKDVDVYENPDRGSKHLGVVMVSSGTTRELSFKEAKLSHTKNEDVTWLKVLSRASEKESYILAGYIERKEYAQINDTKTFNLQPEYYDVTYDENEDYEDKLSTLVSDVKIFDKPEHLKGYKEVGKLAKGQYVQIEEVQETVYYGENTKWVKVRVDGLPIGYIPESQVIPVDPDKELLYTLKEGEDLVTVMRRFTLSPSQLRVMNLTADMDDVKPGDAVRVRQRSITYDTTYTKVTSPHGLRLVQDMMYASDAMLDKGLKPSVAYAQAILESAAGTSDLARYNHNLFGIKGKYNGQGSAWVTNEDYGNGMVKIVDTFRAYPSKLESLMDYIDLISNNTRYAGAVNADTAYEAVQAIKSGGYATDTAYVAKIMKVITDYDLTQFDIR